MVNSGRAAPPGGNGLHLDVRELPSEGPVSVEKLGDQETLRVAPEALIGVATHVLLTGAVWPSETRLESFLEG